MKPERSKLAPLLGGARLPVRWPRGAIALRDFLLEFGDLLVESNDAQLCHRYIHTLYNRCVRALGGYPRGCHALLLPEQIFLQTGMKIARTLGVGVSVAQRVLSR